ncbi:MAG TPA: hypothetical protein ENK37_09330 [Oceanithermus profundus]|uniref:Uncharacterized protein n=1 Tax=Oceanithermus profundus TaxID=187137 RepID=A0A7C4VHC8_9DEIN|nr:hypothetical protein [Oceanithermus profundus]
MSEFSVAQATEDPTTEARRAIVARIAEVVGILRTAASEIGDGGDDEMGLLALALRELAAAKKAMDLLRPAVGLPDPELAKTIARQTHHVRVEILPREVPRAHP